MYDGSQLLTHVNSNDNDNDDINGNDNMHDHQNASNLLNKEENKGTKT